MPAATGLHPSVIMSLAPGQAKHSCCNIYQNTAGRTRVTAKFAVLAVELLITVMEINLDVEIVILCTVGDHGPQALLG